MTVFGLREGLIGRDVSKLSWLVYWLLERPNFDSDDVRYHMHWEVSRWRCRVGETWCYPDQALLPAHLRFRSPSPVQEIGCSSWLLSRC